MLFDEPLTLKKSGRFLTVIWRSTTRSLLINKGAHSRADAWYNHRFVIIIDIIGLRGRDCDTWLKSLRGGFRYLARVAGG